MKRSKLDKLLHEAEVLEKKIVAFHKVRRRIAQLSDEMKDDPYCLEALLSIDKNIFNMLVFMQRGLVRLRESIKRLEREDT